MSETMPSDVEEGVSFFDRFAATASAVCSRAPFFVFCVLLVVIWVPSVFVIRDIDTWQLIINTITTVVTFLLVALLQNSSTRGDKATQHKLNAIAAALADLIQAQPGSPSKSTSSWSEDADELRSAVGIEERESA